MSETPLHVAVAQALGWTGTQDRGDGMWLGIDPKDTMVREVPPFGRTWCSTGNLVSDYGILLGPEFSPDADHKPTGKWSAMLAKERTNATIVRGNGACEAVGNLIVALSKEGKLCV